MNHSCMPRKKLIYYYILHAAKATVQEKLKELNPKRYIIIYDDYDYVLLEHQ